MDKAQGNDSGDWNLALGKSASLLLGKSFNSESQLPQQKSEKTFPCSHTSTLFTHDATSSGDEPLII